VSRTAWIIVLVGVGVVAAVLVGVLGTRNEPSKAEAASTLCASVKTLGASATKLVQIDPGTATKQSVQSDVDAVKSDWSQVKSDAQDVRNAPTGDLSTAWSNFTAAVKSVPSASSVQDAVNSVKQAGQQLASTAQSTASEMHCG
jgi:hypothetical protein